LGLKGLDTGVWLQVKVEQTYVELFQSRHCSSMLIYS